MKPTAYSVLVFSIFFAFALPATGADVILNEYNAVSSSRWLDEDGLDASDKSDTRIGRIEGNGGNWFELAVVGDGIAGSTVDMRGWKLSWIEEDDNGEIVLSSDDFWSAVPAGTLLTIGENEIITSQDGSEIVNGSNILIDFSSGDNWAHIHSADESYIANTNTNVEDDLDEMGNPIFGPVGEGADGVDAGIGSREVFKLETNVITSVDLAAYNDGTTSTFGAPNIWSSDDESFAQDFSSFGVGVPEPAGWLPLLIGLAALGIRQRRYE